MAEEVAQDVMATLWRSTLFDPAKQAFVSTWIFAIARLRRIDML
jgi:RNA polymerase sigma-70 factor (ECF subfamily)